MKDTLLVPATKVEMLAAEDTVNDMADLFPDVLITEKGQTLAPISVYFFPAQLNAGTASRVKSVWGKIYGCNKAIRTTLNSIHPY